MTTDCSVKMKSEARTTEVRTTEPDWGPYSCIYKQLVQHAKGKMPSMQGGVECRIVLVWLSCIRV